MLIVYSVQKYWFNLAKALELFLQTLFSVKPEFEIRLINIPYLSLFIQSNSINMKVKSLFFLVFAAVIFSCGTSSNSNVESSSMLAEDSLEHSEIVPLDTVSEDYILLKNQCLICHGGAPSHDKLIAPPMAAVKWRYSKQHNNKEGFVNGIVAWGLNPNADKALMRGAVKEFNVMPKPATKEEDLRTIAAFIYDNELEQPEWFEEHFNQMHGEGGNGMGMGKGMQKRKSK